MTVYWNIVIWDKESAGYIKKPLISIQVEAAVYGFYEIHNHLDNDVGNREIVCLLEAIMKASLLI